MATVFKVREDMAKSKMTPEDVQSKLFYLSDAAHKLHLDTKSYAEHKALGKLYEGLIAFRDEISEKLMGYMNGKRIGGFSVGKLPEYSAGESMKLADEVVDFAKDLCDYAASNKFIDLENVGQSLSGLGAQTKYLLTLK